MHGLGPGLLLAIFALLWLGGALDASWRYDDGFHLDFARHLSPWQYFLDSAVARAQSGVHLTPWNTLFYDLNIALFGARPGLHYLHLLVVVFVTAWLAYALARTFAGSLPSLGAALVFLAGAPTFQVANELMAGHYAYGLLFAAGAALAFVCHRARGSLVWLGLSVALYLAACASKEVFAPLPLILLALPGAPLRRRLLEIAPFAAVAGVYLAWRFAVLGVLVGGYGHEPLPVGATLRGLLELPRILSASPDWAAPRPIVLSAALAAAVALALRRGRSAVLLLGAGIVAAGLPLYVLARMSLLETPGRYLYVPWFLLSLLFASLISTMPVGRSGQGVLMLGLVSVAALSTGAHRPLSAADARPSEALYSVIAEHEPGERILLPAETQYPLMYQMFAFAHARITQAPYRRDLLIASSVDLCRALHAGERVLAYDPVRERFGEAAPDALWKTAAALDERRRTCFDPDELRPQPLSVELGFADGFLNWRLGPHAGGAWRYLFDGLPVCPVIPAAGGYPLAARPMTLRFLYESPQGRRTVSPVFELGPEAPGPIDWSGVAEQRIETLTRAQCMGRGMRAQARRPASP